VAQPLLRLLRELGVALLGGVGLLRLTLERLALLLDLLPDLLGLGGLGLQLRRLGARGQQVGERYLRAIAQLELHARGIVALVRPVGLGLGLGLGRLGLGRRVLRRWLRVGLWLLGRQGRRVASALHDAERGRGGARLQAGLVLGQEAGGARGVERIGHRGRRRGGRHRRVGGHAKVPMLWKKGAECARSVRGPRAG
jgi:hypothetical protein